MDGGSLPAFPAEGSPRRERLTDLPQSQRRVNEKFISVPDQGQTLVFLGCFFPPHFRNVH